uniref:Uncharacterized protein n=1 Tax=Cacopsylla melanoneura TaxID=428564 RepID=A0A8D8U662_9HEMI
MGEMCSIRLRWLRVLLLASGPCSLIYLFTSLRCDISETQPTSPTIPPSCSISFDLPTISISSSLFHRLLSLFVPIPTTISLSLSLLLVPCSLSPHSNHGLQYLCPSLCHWFRVIPPLQSFCVNPFSS